MGNPKKSSSKDKPTLTPEEKELLVSYEADEWKSIGLDDKIKKKYQASATATLAKTKRINIRLNQLDLQSIQKKAFEEGLPYQTFLSSLIHKYVNGKLVEK